MRIPYTDNWGDSNCCCCPSFQFRKSRLIDSLLFTQMWGHAQGCLFSPFKLHKWILHVWNGESHIFCGLFRCTCNFGSFAGCFGGLVRLWLRMLSRKPAPTWSAVELLAQWNFPRTSARNVCHWAIKERFFAQIRDWYVRVIIIDNFNILTSYSTTSSQVAENTKNHAKANVWCSHNFLFSFTNSKGQPCHSNTLRKVSLLELNQQSSGRLRRPKVCWPDSYLFREIKRRRDSITKVSKSWTNNLQERFENSFHD